MQKHDIALSLHPLLYKHGDTETDKVQSSLMHMHKSYIAAKQMGAARVCVHTALPWEIPGECHKEAHIFLKTFWMILMTNR